MSENWDGRPIVSRKALRERAQELAAASGEDLTWREAWQQAQVSASQTSAASDAEYSTATNSTAESLTVGSQPVESQPVESPVVESPTVESPIVESPQLLTYSADPDIIGSTNFEPPLPSTQPDQISRRLVRDKPIRRSTASRPLPQSVPAQTPPSAKPMRATRLQATGRNPIVSALGIAAPAAPLVGEVAPIDLIPVGRPTYQDQIAASSLAIPPATEAIAGPAVVVVPDVAVVEQSEFPPIIVPGTSFASGMVSASSVLSAPEVEAVSVEAGAVELGATTAGPTTVFEIEPAPNFEAVPPWESITTNKEWATTTPAHEPQAPIPEATVDQAGTYSSEATRPSAGYTWLHYLILIAVAFVLGLLIWQLINSGVEPVLVDSGGQPGSGTALLGAGIVTLGRAR